MLGLSASVSLNLPRKQILLGFREVAIEHRILVGVHYPLPKIEEVAVGISRLA